MPADIGYPFDVAIARWTEVGCRVDSANDLRDPVAAAQQIVQASDRGPLTMTLSGWRMTCT